MNKSKKLLLGLGVAFTALLLLPWLMPMDDYITQAEEAAATELGMPVSIGDMRLALLPSPRLAITYVAISDNQIASAEEVIIAPALTSLFSNTKILSNIKIIRPVIKEEVFALLAGMVQDEVASSPSVYIRHVVIDEGVLALPGITLPPLNVDIALGTNNRPEHVLVRSVDDKLNAKLVPAKGYQAISLIAHNWTLPVGAALLVDELNAEMALYESRLEIRQMHASLCGGRINGSANLG